MSKKTASKEKLPLLVGDASAIFSGLGASKNTLRAYTSDWAHFEAWCTARNKAALPAAEQQVAAYLRSCAEQGLKLSTVQRRLAAISELHAQHRHPSPSDTWEVRNTIRQLRRDLGNAAVSKKPLTLDDLRAMLDRCPETLTGLRDRAVLLLGFCTALRRSELVQLQVSDLQLSDEGLVLNIRAGTAARRKLALPFGKHARTCPVKVLGTWLIRAKIESGPIFRAVNKSGKLSPYGLSDRVIADIVKKYCVLIGRRASAFSGYSLRTGFAIAATQAGASQSSIRRQTGHSSLEALRRYTGDAAIFQDHALRRLDI